MGAFKEAAAGLATGNALVETASEVPASETGLSSKWGKFVGNLLGRRHDVCITSGFDGSWTKSGWIA